jgi:DNA replication protein DnaC
MEQNQNQKIESYARQLRLPVFRKHFLEYAQQAAKEKQSHEEYLLRLMMLEQDERTERRLQQRVRRAKFPSQNCIFRTVWFFVTFGESMQKYWYNLILGKTLSSLNDN